MNKETKVPDGYHIERGFWQDAWRALRILLLGMLVGGIIEWQAYGRWQQFLGTNIYGAPLWGWLMFPAFIIAVLILYKVTK